MPWTVEGIAVYVILYGTSPVAFVAEFVEFSKKCITLQKSYTDMPTIFIVFGFIFKFYSDDHEPIHVHVIKGGCEAKYNIEPEIHQVFNHGFKKHEISMIESVIEENVEVIKNHWIEYFKIEK